MIAAPNNIRDLLDAMAEHPPGGSVEDFIDRFDWSTLTVQGLYSTFYDRLPESQAVVRDYVRISPRVHALNAIRGGEFQTRIVELVLKAYPEKQRLIHVHIPKTAGVDVRAKFEASLPFMHLDHRMRESYSPSRLFLHLVEVAARARGAGQIFATGHMPLAWYIDRNMYRPTDRLFTIVREPMASLMSLANFCLRRFNEDPDCASPDTRAWARSLGFDRFDATMDVEAQRDIARTMLRTESWTRPILATTMLGRGSLASAMDLIIRSNIELTPLETYKAWLSEQWGIDSTTRENASPKVLRMEDLDEAQRASLATLCEEDLELHRRIMKAWGRVGGTRIFGSDLMGD